MDERTPERAIVPNVVGMPFHVGRDVASKAGVTLANPDPDGPPISALAWPGLFYITWQHPSAGTEVDRWDSVVIEVVEHGDAHSNAIREGPSTLPTDSAHATPDRNVS
ncbi:PASTA domain-containing protein [Crystallibacter degradans]|uniref:PASTA domain-containing protein n=1 Tax=Crystallibacter degradans TaxID=2726743 RepID=UPI001475F122|nr:hypothetical protein [Arthrobacter sp. SF27]NMR31854.1 hypothetical protein [Arthrobacter sp. SF27]